MLDTARHFFNVTQVKKVLFLMSMHKFNVLHLHLSDDQGWRIEVQSRPELAKVGGTRGRPLNKPAGEKEGEKIFNGTVYKEPHFFSRHDIHEIIGFAALWGIEVVPEIDLPAHTAALIASAKSVGKNVGVIELHEGCAEQLAGLGSVEAKSPGLSQTILRNFFTEPGQSKPSAFMVGAGELLGGARALKGSTDAALSARNAKLGLEEFAKLGKHDPGNYTGAPNCMAGTHGIVVPTKDAVQYVLGAVAEVADLFPSKYFHMGGDEAEQFRDQAYSSDVARELMKSLGLQTPAALQGHMVNQVHKILQARGKTVIAYDETHVGLEGYTPPKDMVMMWWRDFSPEASWSRVQASGRTVILAPISNMYLDLYQVEPHAASRHRVQEGTVGLHDTYKVMKMFDSARILGAHTLLWSEHLKTQKILEYQMFPRAAAAAEVAWSQITSFNFTHFLHRWEAHKKRLHFMNVEYYPGNYTNIRPYRGVGAPWCPTCPQ